ncbi:MAG: hypothetical protein CL678_10115 [Bdellovibrionaceae bacterium]|nr:hypothetical protein [Pseudobdellovibrionaceae bacterium]|tara:strand:- start:2517 stop:3086 length:570 start_codon:yes stop_codon:yes gene_type:complete
MSFSQFNLTSEAGQSTIEFALAVTIIVGVTIFIFQFSMSLAVGNFFHYATFMAARAYQSAGATPDDQSRRAKLVLSKTTKKSVSNPGIDRWPFFAKGVGEGSFKGAKIGNHSRYQEKNNQYHWLKGVEYSFQSKLFAFPGGGALDSGERDPANVVTLTSESWLGRETSYDECMEYMRTFDVKVVLDNGC